MESALEYMAALYPTLSRDYTDKKGNKASCFQIATDIAERLCAQNKLPQLMKVESECTSRIYTAPIFPKLQSKVSWGVHVVCCLDGQAYDPMVSSEPVSLEKYQAAFSGGVKIDIWIPKERILGFI